MLNKLKERNTKVCINTGRSYLHLVEDMQKHKIEVDYYIASSGAEILDSKGQRLYGHEIDHETVDKVLEEIFLNATISYGIGMKNSMQSNFKKDLDVWDMSLITPIDDSVYTISTKLETEEKALLFKHHLESVCNVSAHVNRISVDITAKGISKKTGIEELSAHLSIPKDKITVIGDSLNDISMIRAYNGHAVENALDEVKEISTSVHLDVGAMIEAVML